MIVSECCGAEIIYSDICSACGEHCDESDEECDDIIDDLPWDEAN